MRRNWPRTRPVIGLGLVDAAKLLAKVIPEALPVSLVPIEGGLTNTNIAVVVAGPPGRVVLRLCQGDPQRARTEAAIVRRIAGYVPVARVLGAAEVNSVTGHPYEVIEWVEGEPLDLVVPKLDDLAVQRLGEALGAVLARIHAFRFPRLGFFAEDLRLPDAIDLGPSALLSYLRQRLIEGPGGERLGGALARETLALAERDGHLLDTWRGDPCLVHGDFNGSNILVRRRDAAWEVAAVLDWEYALSGIPAMDFANLMRPALGDRAPFVQGLAHGYRRAGGKLPDDWRRIALIADLFAWADILGRPEIAPPVLEDARAAVRRALDRGQAG